MSRRRLVLAGILAFFAGLVWQLPLAAVLPALLAASDGRLAAGRIDGTWHTGSATLVCRTPDRRTHDCGFHRIALGMAELAPQASLRSAGGGLRATGWPGWTVEIDEMRLPAATLAAVLPLAGQMQIEGDLRVRGRAEGASQELRESTLSVAWRGEIHGFSFAPQTLEVGGDGRQMRLRWLPTEGLPRFEGGVECDARAACSGVVYVQTDGQNADLSAFLAAGGRRDAADPGRYEYRVNVR